MSLLVLGILFFIRLVVALLFFVVEPASTFYMLHQRYMNGHFHIYILSTSLHYKKIFAAARLYSLFTSYIADWYSPRPRFINKRFLYRIRHIYGFLIKYLFKLVNRHLYVVWLLVLSASGN